MSKLEQLKNEIAALEAAQQTTPVQAPEPTSTPETDSVVRREYQEYCAWNSRTYGTKNPTFSEWLKIRETLKLLDEGKLEIK